MRPIETRCINDVIVIAHVNWPCLSNIDAQQSDDLDSDFQSNENRGFRQGFILPSRGCRIRLINNASSKVVLSIYRVYEGTFDENRTYRIY